jgi:hypothetical protein
MLTPRSSRAATCTVLAALALTFSLTAPAAIIQPPGPVLPPGSLPLSGQITATTSTGSGVNPTLAPSGGSYHYGDTFAGPTDPIGSSSWGFYDAFVFTVGGSLASSVTTTINLGSMLGITDLQERLYSANPGESAPFVGTPPAASGPGYFLGWTSVLPGGTGEVAVLQTVPLAPGTYVLEIRGLVNGSLGGSYAGVLNVHPVPLPAALPMLLSGLGLLGGAFIRRQRRFALRSRPAKA